MGLTASLLPSEMRVSATPSTPSPSLASGNVLRGISGTVASPPFASKVKSPMPSTNGTDLTCSSPCVFSRLSQGYAEHSWYVPEKASRKQCFFTAKFGMPALTSAQYG